MIFEKEPEDFLGEKLYLFENEWYKIEIKYAPEQTWLPVSIFTVKKKRYPFFQPDIGYFHESKLAHLKFDNFNFVESQDFDKLKEVINGAIQTCEELEKAINEKFF